MSKVKQKQSVINEVNAALGSSFDSSLPARDQLTDSQLKTIKDNIVAGICNGDIEFSRETSDIRDVSKYVSGMISNYFRKAKELNGWETYVAQSNGTVRSSDVELMELGKLLRSYKEGSKEYEQVFAAINARRQELGFLKKQMKKVKKVKKAKIDIDSLPENLKDLAKSLTA